MKTLYIIGNGFDLYHKFPTSYKDFKNYLQSLSDTSELIYCLDTYFNGDIWSDFENAFGNFSIENFLSDNENLLPDEDSERDGERYILPDYAEKIVKDLIIGLYNKLNDWILSINSIKGNKDLLPLDTSAFFLTFNYSNTLERLYSITDNNILHLHGIAEKRFDFSKHPDYCYEPEKKDTNIAFGHAFDPSKTLNIKPINKGINAWVEEEAIENLIIFFEETIKDTAQIINTHNSFFDTGFLNQFDKLIIIGHSFSDVDLPYFKKIATKAININECIITYYGEKNLNRIKKDSNVFTCNKTYINLEYDDITYLK